MTIVYNTDSAGATTTWGNVVANALGGGRMHLQRTIPTELEMSEGQLFGRLVPFGVVARVVDRMSDGSVQRYLEGFRPGIFSRQLRAKEPGVIRRINLVHTHEKGDILGPAMSMEERDDGVHGEFRVFRSRRSDVEDLIEAGVSELSVHMLEMPNGFVREDGVVWRTDGHLIDVAIEAMGSYREGAQILAYRNLDEFADEQAAEDEATRQRAAVAEAEAAAAQKSADEVAEKARRQAEALEWAAEAERQQAELAARYK